VHSFRNNEIVVSNTPVKPVDNARDSYPASMPAATIPRHHCSLMEAPK